jgi:uncharacterized protein
MSGGGVNAERGEGAKPLIAFLVVAFAGAAALALIAPAVSRDSAATPTTLGLFAMFVPSIAVLLVRVLFRAHVPDAGWRRFPVRWFPVALFVFPAAVHAVALPATVLLEGSLPWADWLTRARDGLFHTPSERGWGTLTTSGLAIRLVMNAIVGLVVVSVLAFFEEIGWRAWMLPRLVTRFGERNAVIASAVIWAAWHVPYALSGIQRIDNVTPATLAILAPFGQIGAGLLLAWLWLRTQSIVILSLAHGSLNNWGQYAFKFMASSGSHDVALLTLVNGALLAVGVLALSRVSPQAENPSQPMAC